MACVLYFPFSDGPPELDLMITLCLAHHAMVTRTVVLLQDWPELLRVLWREQHPDAHEQTALVFAVLGPPAQQTFLLDTDRMSHAGPLQGIRDRAAPAG